MSEIHYDTSRKHLIKGLNISSIDEIGKPISCCQNQREHNTERDFSAGWHRHET